MVGGKSSGTAKPQPSYWLRREKAVTSRSRLGGLPSLAAALDWPRHGERGAPLHFLAQIELARLPPFPATGSSPRGGRLPASGMLYFFADLEEEMIWSDRGDRYASTRVLFAPQAGSDRPLPEDLPDIGHSYGELHNSYQRGEAIRTFPATPVAAYVADSYSGDEDMFRDGVEPTVEQLIGASIEKATGAPLPVLQGLHANVRSASAAVHERRIGANEDGPLRRDTSVIRHQMLGLAKSEQGTGPDLQRSGTILLLQLESDTYIHSQFMFCDMGVVQYWIEPADLAAGRFQKAWGTTEGG